MSDLTERLQEAFEETSGHEWPELLEARARIEQLEAALRFYADKENWCPSQHLKGVFSGKYYTPAEDDGGYKASTALKQEKPE